MLLMYPTSAIAQQEPIIIKYRIFWKTFVSRWQKMDFGLQLAKELCNFKRFATFSDTGAKRTSKKSLKNRCNRSLV